MTNATEYALLIGRISLRFVTKVTGEVELSFEPVGLGLQSKREVILNPLYV